MMAIKRVREYDILIIEDTELDILKDRGRKS